MTASEANTSRRDLLVQQLLEERRTRLQQKLAAGLQDEEPRSLRGSHSPGGIAEPWTPSGLHDSEPKDDGFLKSVLARLTAAEKAEMELPAELGASPFLVADLESKTARRPQSAPSKAKPASGRASSAKPAKAESTEHRRQSSVKDRQAFEQRVQKWQLQHQASKQKYMQAKQEKEMEELGECTFQPSINTRSEFYARRSRGCVAEPLPERLFHEADKRANLRNKAKEIMEADSLCSYTFQPQINQSKSQGSRAPLHQRAEALQKRREERVRSAQLAEERRADNYFQPKISSRSERLVQRKRDQLYRCASQGQVDCLKQLGPVEERLYAEAQEKEQRRVALQDFHAAEAQSLPSMDDTSRKICKLSVYFQGEQQDFLTRQQTFELAKQKRIEVRAQHMEKECSFQPKITETSRQLVCNNVEMLGETPEERINRLAIRDAERREQTRQELELLHHKDCTFKPEINPTSQVLAASRYEASSASASEEGPHERLYRSGVSKSRLMDDACADQYSFRPQLDPQSRKRYAHVKSRYSNRQDLMESIRQEQEKKAEYLLERRRELEEERIADCTFAPRVAEAFQDIQKPVVVSGLDRYFELKNLAQRKQQEQKEREQKIFRPESVAPRQRVTIPEPFELSGCRKCEESHREFNEALHRVAQDCTFTPQTNESQNREIIKQIMGMVEVH
ncbi:unnamed protein product [Effrenium voratum]|nr:unnamed protein product [Effrenium voratum]